VFDPITPGWGIRWSREINNHEREYMAKVDGNHSAGECRFLWISRTQSVFAASGGKKSKPSPVSKKKERKICKRMRPYELAHGEVWDKQTSEEKGCKWKGRRDVFYTSLGAEKHCVSSSGGPESAREANRRIIMPGWKAGHRIGRSCATGAGMSSLDIETQDRIVDKTTDSRGGEIFSQRTTAIPQRARD